ncbi:MAG: DHH family phosphoesterase [Bacilli bacterium]|nr:DHH family phosphoesterase [Bacilli bacterium]
MAILEELLKFYNLDIEEYGRLKEAPSFDSIPRIDDAESVKDAIKRLTLAKQNKEKILVYGDYDTDGVMSTSILVRALREFGNVANGYLPSRYKDGYGLNVANVEKIASSNYSIIFTCDNGITAFDAIKRAKELGMDVIVLDHHTIEEGKLPEADVIIHPTLLNYGEYSISAGFLSFLFSMPLLGKRDDYLFTLGAISTISDMMPLKGYNRTAVRLLNKHLQDVKYSEIYALSKKEVVDTKVLQLEIIPKINAVGRMEKEPKSINRLIAYFAENDKAKKEAIATFLDNINEHRKEETKSAAESFVIEEGVPAIVVKADIPEGLNGLIANRLLQEYALPCVVFSPADAKPGLLVGSVRSRAGFDVIECLTHVKVDLVAYGGHSFAGGVTIKSEDFDKFKKEFAFYAIKHKLEKKNDGLIDINLSDCNMNTYHLIESFAPFGQEWPEPKFLLRNMKTKDFTFTKDGRFLSSFIAKDVKLFSFSIGENTFPEDTVIDLQITFAVDEFRGRKSLSLFAEKQ